MNKEKIINGISFGIVVASAILILILRNDILKVAMVVGVGALLYGICNIIKKNSLGCMFFSVGLSLVITLLLYRNVLDKNDSITFMICSSTFLIIIFTLIYMYLNEKNIFKIYDMEVVGTVVDLIKNPNTNKEFYQVVYEYNIENKVYSVTSPVFINKNIPNIGDKIKIFVEAKDFESVYFDKTKKQKISNILLCLILMIVSLFIIVNLFR